MSYIIRDLKKDDIDHLANVFANAYSEDHAH